MARSRGGGAGHTSDSGTKRATVSTRPEPAQLAPDDKARASRQETESLPRSARGKEDEAAGWAVSVEVEKFGVQLVQIELLVLRWRGREAAEQDTHLTPVRKGRRSRPDPNQPSSLRMTKPEPLGKKPKASRDRREVKRTRPRVGLCR